MAALQYLESLRNSQPELADWYNSLADLYQKKLWHQLTLKLEQFVALAVFQVPLFLCTPAVLCVSFVSTIVSLGFYFVYFLCHCWCELDLGVRGVVVSRE